MKYEKLWKYIKEKNEVYYKMTFKDINSILGFSIDHSFLQFKKDLNKYGYKVKKISLKEKNIIFEKLIEKG